MITVVCKVMQCPYRTGNGFCNNRLLSITSSGLCGHIYKDDGVVKNNWMIKAQEEEKDEEEK